MTMLKHDVSIIMGVREGRMAFQENIEENMTRIFNQLCEEDLCRVSLYYETIALSMKLITIQRIIVCM